MIDDSSSRIDHVLIVGAGVVGRAIAIDHLRAGIEVWMADLDEMQLRTSCDLVLGASGANADSASPWGMKIELPIVHLFRTRDDSEDNSGDEPGSQPVATRSSVLTPRWLLIESIAERVEIKQTFFANAETWFDAPPVLTTNTSTLPIGSIASSMQSPQRLCGLHFFMPVVDRPAAEIIPHRSDESGTAAEVIEACCHHARRLGKTPLTVRDSPGFVVNRLLAPYLNLATDLLCGGVAVETIQQAALRYGMPLSPFQLIDLIGTRTAFDGGRVVWSAFPHRMNPSPLLPALVKRKLAGVAVGEGFHQYDDTGTQLADTLSPSTAELVETYAHDRFCDLPVSEEHRIEWVADLFAAAFRCEAIAIVRDGVADTATIDAAMRGGLRWNPDGTNAGPIERITATRAKELADHFPNLKSIQLLT